MKNDDASERQRLAEHYGRVTDDELLNLARDLDALTDVAREAITAEMARRNLQPEKPEDVHASSENPAGANRTDGELDRENEVERHPRNDRPARAALRNTIVVPDNAVLVTIAQFRDLPDALIAQGSLESAGIACALLDDNMVRMDWLWSNGIGGMRLQVLPADVEEARTILGEAIPGSFEIEGEGTYQQPACPKCGSLDVNLHETSPLGYGSLFVMPFPFVRSGWRCRECGFQWRDAVDDDPVRTPDL